MGIEARAILAVTNYFGARDFADNKPASYENVQSREYHHIFPDALMREAGLKSNLALNCALITRKTNRIIGRKDPLDYMKERVEWAGEKAVSERLKSHLASYEILRTAKYDGLVGDSLKEALEPDYRAFAQERAKLVHQAAQRLTRGEQPTLDEIWANA